MPTGACGINCDVCRLNLLGICSTCGSGRSQEALRKIAAQYRLFGAPCPILECAIEDRIEYCSRDCDKYPCNRFKDGPYPFSEGYLNMQERRRKEDPQAKTPTGYDVNGFIQHWEDLGRRDADKICNNALAKNHPPNGFLLPFLKEYLLVDMQQRCILRQVHNDWEQIDNTLLELLCLAYLLNAKPDPLKGEMISVKELKTAHFFQGPHELKVRPLIDRYGSDLDGFKRAAENAGGESIDMADAAYMFQAFPRVPLYYLFWEGDEEFRPRLSVLFDRSIERHLATDIIWGVVNLLSDILLMGDRWYLSSGH